MYIEPTFSRILTSKPCSVTKVYGEVNSNRKRKRTKVEFTSDSVSGVKYQCSIDNDKFEDCELMHGHNTIASYLSLYI